MGIIDKVTNPKRVGGGKRIKKETAIEIKTEKRINNNKKLVKQ
jgi:hypothetical protein